MSQPFIGQVAMFAGTFAPRGWMFCNGQSLPIAQNQALFAIIGTTYGGNGTTTFNLPNLQGRFAIHPSPTIPLGQSAGSASVTLTTQNLAAHTHVATFTPAGGGSSSLQATSAPANSSTPAGNYIADAVDPSGTLTGPLQSYATPAAAAGKLGNVAGLAVSGGGGTVTNAVTGNSTPVPTMPPYQAINHIIAITGVFPVRN